MTDAHQSSAEQAGFETAAPFWSSLATRLSGHAHPLFKLPPAAASRMVIVFVALASIKLALLIGSGKHLHEIHWRVGRPPSGWSCYAALFAFVGIGVWSLVQLGRHCQPVGIRAVRAANAIVMLFGLLLILLTFHEGDNNYLYPVVTGTLSWKSLGPYLSLDLFFRPPFLAAWILGYALAYYVLVRTRRERWVLRLTAAFAGAYGLVCLRGFSEYRNEFAVASCFGLASLIYLRRPGKEFNAAWLLVPLAWALFAWGLFYFETPSLHKLNSYFLLVAGGSVLLFGAVVLLARAGGYYHAWIKVTPFYFVAFFLLASTHYPMAKNYNNLLCYAFQFPHYFMGELAVAGCLALCVALYGRLRPQGRFWWLDVVGLALVALAFVDLRLSRIMDVRLGWDLLSFADSPRMMWRMSRPYLPGLAAALAVTVVVYALMLRGAQAWVNRHCAGRVQPRPSQGGWYAAACFGLLGVLGLSFVKPDNAEGQAALRLVHTSPWWKRTTERTLSREEFLNSAIALGLRDFQRAAPAQAARPRRDLNVLLVFMESSYNKHLSLFGGKEETQPLLSKYKDRMEIFPNFFSSYASSIHARFATFTSLYPVSDFGAFTLNRVEVKSIFEVLNDEGYTCSMFYSSFFDYTGFRSFLKQRGIEEMYDADTMPGQRSTERISWGLQESETLAAMRQQIKKYAADNRQFFLTYIPAAPHYPYDKIPEQFQKYQREEYRNFTPLYLNELLYMDWVIASIVDELKASGLLDKTLVIITADHGEMLGGKGSALGHGWAVTPELTNVPLIIMDPDKPGYRINDTIGSQVDLLPTVLDVLGVAVPSGELYEGHSLYATHEETNRLIYLNSYQQYGVLAGKQFLGGDRKLDEGNDTDSNKSAFIISNDGCRTVFTEDTTKTNRTIPIRQFDAFQANFLRNYSFYRESLAKGEAGNVQQAKP